MVTGSGLCAKVVVVDARHHMLGRLASILAKELLNGQRVVGSSSSSSSVCWAGFSSLLLASVLKSTFCAQDDDGIW